MKKVPFRVPEPAKKPLTNVAMRISEEALIVIQGHAKRVKRTFSDVAGRQLEEYAAWLKAGGGK